MISEGLEQLLIKLAQDKQKALSASVITIGSAERIHILRELTEIEITLLRGRLHICAGDEHALSQSVVVTELVRGLPYNYVHGN